MIISDVFTLAIDSQTDSAAYISWKKDLDIVLIEIYLNGCKAVWFAAAANLVRHGE